MLSVYEIFGSQFDLYGQSSILTSDLRDEMGMSLGLAILFGMLIAAFGIKSRIFLLDIRYLLFNDTPFWVHDTIVKDGYIQRKTLCFRLAPPRRMGSVAFRTQ